MFNLNRVMMNVTPKTQSAPQASPAKDHSRSPNEPFDHGRADNIANNRYLQQVIEIENQARKIHDDAVQQAQSLPIQAEQETQALIEKAQQEAQEQARTLVDNAQAQEACERIQKQTDEKIRRMKNLAMSQFNNAVGYVLNRLAGGE